MRVRGAISNLHKAVTAARAFARPRGDVERSETVVSEKNPHTTCVVRMRGTTSNLHKAAIAARAFARPRGDVERSETVVSEKNPHTPVCGAGGGTRTRTA